MKQTKIILISILAGIMLVLIAGMAWVIWDLKTNPTANMARSWGRDYALSQELEYEPEDIEKIKVNFANSYDVLVYYGESDKIIVKEYKAESQESAQISCDSKVLKIENKKGSEGIHLGFGARTGGYVELYLPDTYRAVLDMELVSGDVNIEKGIGSCTVNTVSGDITIGEWNGFLSMETVSGDVDASGLVVSDQTVVNTTSGDVDLQFSSFAGKLEVDTVSGDVDIQLPETAEFSFEIHTVSGDFHDNEDEKLSYSYKKKNKQIDGTRGENSENTIRVETVSGDIDLNIR